MSDQESGQLEPAPVRDWASSIPRQLRETMGKEITRQMFQLPANLFLEWMTAKPIERRWFQEASKYIYIPYPEYWE